MITFISYIFKCSKKNQTEESKNNNDNSMNYYNYDPFEINNTENFEEEQIQQDKISNLDFEEEQIQQDEISNLDEIPTQKDKKIYSNKANIIVNENQFIDNNDFYDLEDQPYFHNLHINTDHNRFILNNNLNLDNLLKINIKKVKQPNQNININVKMLQDRMKNITKNICEQKYTEQIQTIKNQIELLNMQYVINTIQDEIMEYTIICEISTKMDELECLIQRSNNECLIQRSNNHQNFIPKSNYNYNLSTNSMILQNRDSLLTEFKEIVLHLNNTENRDKINNIYKMFDTIEKKQKKLIKEEQQDTTIQDYILNLLSVIQIEMSSLKIERKKQKKSNKRPFRFFQMHINNNTTEKKHKTHKIQNKLSPNQENTDKNSQQENILDNQQIDENNLNIQINNKPIIENNELIKNKLSQTKSELIKFWSIKRYFDMLNINIYKWFTNNHSDQNSTYIDSFAGFQKTRCILQIFLQELFFVFLFKLKTTIETETHKQQISNQELEYNILNKQFESFFENVFQHEIATIQRIPKHIIQNWYFENILQENNLNADEKKECIKYYKSFNISFDINEKQ